MSRILLPLSLTATLLGGAALAEVPRVAVDVAPVHSLVAQVMDGVGTPDLLVPAGATPHEHSLRPSEAEALQEADLVFWVGEDLTPWLPGAIETLAPDAAVTKLLEAEGTFLLGVREGALFEADEHDDEEDHEDEMEEASGEFNVHAWLSPRNAAAWLDVIAGQLSQADPENAQTYSANAAAAQAEMETLSAEVNSLLEPVRGGQFIVFHDAYQYFETDFDIPASGAISVNDASEPGPARIAEIQARIAEEGIDCVLAEPQFNPGLVATVLDGTQANTAVIDPLGAELEVGPTLYPQLLRNMATNLAGCL